MVSHTMENMQFGDLHVGTDFPSETALIDRAGSWDLALLKWNLQRYIESDVVLPADTKKSSWLRLWFITKFAKRRAY